MKTPFTWVYLLLFVAMSTYGEDTIELQTTTIKANTELPKILYVVPWQDINEDSISEQKLTLHSLFGDIFDPVRPSAPQILIESPQ